MVTATASYHMAVHPSEPLRCLGTGLVVVEGNHHSYSKNPPCRREMMGFVPQVPVLTASSAVYCAGCKCSCRCMDTVLTVQQCQAVSCVACKSCNLKRSKGLAVHSMTILVMV